MKRLHILRSGMQALVQDAGRFGLLRFGVPFSGAADALSLRVGNILVGNNDGAAGLEVLPGAFAMRFEGDALVAIVGARVVATVSDDKVQNRPVPTGRPLLIRHGSTLAITRFIAGMRVYIAIAGGVDVAEVLGSRSTYLYGKFGGYEGRPLKKDDVVPIGQISERSARIAALLGVQATKHSRTWMSAGWFATGALTESVPDAEDIFFGKEATAGIERRNRHRFDNRFDRHTNRHTDRYATLRIVRGMHAEEFSGASWQQLCSMPFRVTPQADRMGVRLEAMLPSDSNRTTTTLQRTHRADIISSATIPGTIQVPPDGRPIILLSDAQTIGGYPIIAHVCSVDIPRVAQLTQRAVVHFREISLETAHHLLRKQEQAINILRYGVDAALRLTM